MPLSLWYFCYSTQMDGDSKHSDLSPTKSLQRHLGTPESLKVILEKYATTLTPFSQFPCDPEGLEVYIMVH